jgi:hypothetical protein
MSRRSDPEDRQLRAMDEGRLRGELEFALEREQSSNAPGMGRNPKARRHFRLRVQKIEAELERRGLSH